MTKQFWERGDCLGCAALEREVDELHTKVKRLRKFARLVETALEAFECNGEQVGNCKRITLNESWFERAKQLFSECE